MKYYKITCETGYAGTTEISYIAFTKNVSNDFLDDYAYELAVDNASNYEYLATGWDNELSENEYEEIIENYYESVYGYWEEVDREEWEENDGEEI